MTRPRTDSETIVDVDIDGLLTLDRALKAMDEEDQAIIVAHYIGGFSQAQIADVYGVTRAQMHSMIRRALRRTRLNLKRASESESTQGKSLHWMQEAI